MGAERKIRFAVNGGDRTVETDPERPLLEVLREDLGLTGTKYGCGEGQCGACSVLMDGKRVNACRIPMSRVDGKTIVTIEGIAAGDELHPVQQAFLDEQAFQCGFCTAGMVIAAVELLERRPNPTDARIITGMNNNICRCCSYPNIVRAVRRAAELKGAKS